MLNTISGETFKEELNKNADQYILVDFWAEWCGPCKQMLPVLTSLAEKYQNKLKVFKCNIDDNFSTAQEFEVASIPHLILFKGSEKQAEFIGYRSEADLDAELIKFMA